ncbi:MAG: tRNA-dihydrouridine synthase B [Cellvibrionaceae bacterium]|jgi:tRNA-dihydrouridine synthase B
MAGVTDLPFRRLCRQLGAGLAVSEMVTSDCRLWNTKKSLSRLAHDKDENPRSVQLAGNDPSQLADAAKANVDMGAQIIDINMGCPAKKVCKKAAGSALLKDEKLVAAILQSVVKAVDVPVTLKIRTGWDIESRNGVTVAKIAEDAGIQALAVHGRTRSCAFRGDVEYDTIADIVSKLSIPVFANGDITSAKHAAWVMDHTKAKAIMIGRGAQGNPWLFREINYFLATGKVLAKPTLVEFCITVLAHIKALHEFYGDKQGSKIARKHLTWYLQKQATCQSLGHPHLDQEYRHTFNRIESAQEQRDSLQSYFETYIETIATTTGERAA